MSPKAYDSRRAQLAAEGAGLSPLLPRQWPRPTALASVGALLVIDVDVFGIDHVRGLFTGALFLRTGPGRAGASAGSCRLTRGGGLARLVERFRELVQRTLDVLGRGAQARSAAFVHGFLGVFESFLSGFEVGFRKLVAIFANGLFSLIDQAVEAVSGIDLLHAAAILFGMRFGFDAHFFGFFLGQAGGGLNGDLLLLSSGLVLGADIEDAVGVDVEGHFDLGHAARRGRNAVEFEGAERTVVLGEFAFALEHVNLDAGLIIGSSRVSLDLARGDGGVARNLRGHNAAESFHAERKRSDVEKENVLHFAGENRALNRRTDSHDFVRVDALVGLFTAEEIAHELLDLGDARRAAHQDNFLDVAGRQLGVFQSLLYGLHGAIEQIAH